MREHGVSHGHRSAAASSEGRGELRRSAAEIGGDHPLVAANVVGRRRCAITFPNSSTTTWSQIPSTRPMSWSTSNIDWPRVDEPAQTPAELLALVRVEPGRRLVEADEPGPQPRAPARSRPACAGPVTAPRAARRPAPSSPSSVECIATISSVAARGVETASLSVPPDGRPVRGDEEVLADREVVEQLDRLPGSRQAEPRPGMRGSPVRSRPSSSTRP